MSRALKGRLICLLLTSALLGSPAVSPASADNGLYEPFPREASKRRAERFVEALPDGAGALPRRLELGREQLARGVVLDPALATAAGPASARASAGGLSGADALLGATVGLLAGLGLPRLLRRGDP